MKFSKDRPPTPTPAHTNLHPASDHTTRTRPPAMPTHARPLTAQHGFLIFKYMTVRKCLEMHPCGSMLIHVRTARSPENLSNAVLTETIKNSINQNFLEVSPISSPRVDSNPGCPLALEKHIVQTQRCSGPKNKDQFFFSPKPGGRWPLNLFGIISNIFPWTGTLQQHICFLLIFLGGPIGCYLPGLGKQQLC